MGIGMSCPLLQPRGTHSSCSNKKLPSILLLLPSLHTLPISRCLIAVCMFLSSQKCMDLPVSLVRIPGQLMGGICVLQSRSSPALWPVWVNLYVGSSGSGWGLMQHKLTWMFILLFYLAVSRTKIRNVGKMCKWSLWELEVGNLILFPSCHWSAPLNPHAQQEKCSQLVTNVEVLWVLISYELVTWKELKLHMHLTSLSAVIADDWSFWK